MTKFLVEDVEGPPKGGFLVEDASGPPPSSWSIGKGLAHGLETALLGAQNTTDKIKGALGMAKGRTLATALAEKLHPENFQSANEGLMDQSKSLGERLTYAPAAMLEGIPGAILDIGQMALPGGLPAKALRMLATHGYREAGSNLDQATGGNPATPLDLARAGIATGLNTGLSMVGTGAALGAGSIGKAAAAGAMDAAGQTAANSALLGGKLPSLEDLVVTGAMGGAAGGAFRGAQEAPGAIRTAIDAPEAARFSRFNETDPRVLAAAAQRLQEATGSYGKIKEANAEDIRLKAIAEAKAAANLAATNHKLGGRDWVKAQLNNITNGGDIAPVEAYVQAMAAANRGEPINAEHLATLKDVIGNTGVGRDWLDKLNEVSVLGELGNMGAAKGDARLGGIHATPAGQTLDRLSKYFGIGSIGGSLGANLMGHAALGQVGLGIGAGTTAFSGMVRGIDKLSGYSNPVGRFAKRFDKQPTITPPPVAPVNANVSPIASVMQDAQGQSKTVGQAKPQMPPQPPQAAQQPPTTPLSLFQQDMGVTPGQSLPPSENKLIGQIMALAAAKGKTLNMAPRPGEDLTAPPERVLPRGAMADFRKPPAPIEPSMGEFDPANNALDAKVQALADKRFKGSIQVEPSEAFKQARAAAFAKREGLPRLKPKEVPTKVSNVKTEAPKQEAPTTKIEETHVPIYETRYLGEGKHPVTLDVAKYSDKEAAWVGAENKVLRRESFLNRVKEKLPTDVHEKIDTEIMRGPFVERGSGRDKAFQAYSNVIDSVTKSKELRTELKKMFKKRGTGLWSLSHWKDD